MDTNSKTIIEVLDNLDEDRYLEYYQFKQVLNFLPMYSKMQAFCLYLGITGFRPLECCRAKIDNLLFQDRQNPCILNLITKSKPKYYYDKTGKLLTVIYMKQKKRLIPLWVRDYFEEYIRRNWQTMSNNYLFPNNRGGHIKSKSMVVLFDKLRKKMYKTDPIKYSWTMDIVKTQYAGNGKINPIHRLSMYAFRKSRVTWYAMTLLEKGISDVLLCCSQFMGHKKLNTTYTYVKKLIADRADGTIVKFKPPNLNKNILGVNNPTTEIDRICQTLANNPKIRQTINKFLNNIKKNNGGI